MPHFLRFAGSGWTVGGAEKGLEGIPVTKGAIVLRWPCSERGAEEGQKAVRKRSCILGWPGCLVGWRGAVPSDCDPGPESAMQGCGERGCLRRAFWIPHIADGIGNFVLCVRFLSGAAGFSSLAPHIGQNPK